MRRCTRPNCSRSSKEFLAMSTLTSGSKPPRATLDYERIWPRLIGPMRIRATSRFLPEPPNNPTVPANNHEHREAAPISGPGAPGILSSKSRRSFPIGIAHSRAAAAAKVSARSSFREPLHSNHGLILNESCLGCFGRLLIALTC
jgi:hypothetical protein